MSVDVASACSEASPRTIADFNPVNWAVDGGREALGSTVEWSFVLSRLGLLSLLAIACGWVATRAFHAYSGPFDEPSEGGRITVAPGRSLAPPCRCRVEPSRPASDAITLTVTVSAAGAD